MTKPLLKKFAMYCHNCKEPVITASAPRGSRLIVGPLITIVPTGQKGRKMSNTEKICTARDEYGNQCERPTPHRKNKYTEGKHYACARSFKAHRQRRRK